jgi:hypothetical protein
MRANTIEQGAESGLSQHPAGNDEKQTHAHPVVDCTPPLFLSPAASAASTVGFVDDGGAAAAGMCVFRAAGGSMRIFGREVAFFFTMSARRLAFVSAPG